MASKRVSLLDDLESIRDLLDASPGEPGEIPLLDDVVGEPPPTLTSRADAPSEGGCERSGQGSAEAAGQESVTEPGEKSDDDEEPDPLDALLEQELVDELAVELDDEHQSRALEGLMSDGETGSDRAAHGEASHETEAGSQRRTVFDKPMIDALLDDHWRESAGRILGTPLAEESQTQGTGEQWRHELNEMLKARVDAEIEEWLSELVQRHIGELRQRLLGAIHKEVTRFTDNPDTPRHHDEDDHE